MLSLLVYFALTLISFAVFFIFIKPYLVTRYFAQKGFKNLYFPLLGFIKPVEQSQKEDGDAFSFMKKAVNDPKLRGITTNFAHKPIVLLFEPKLIKQFFSNPDLYTKPDMMFSLFKDFIDGGLLFINGQEWKIHRKLVSMAFHYELLKEMIADFGKITQEFFDKVKKGEMKNVSIMNEYQTITGEAVGRLFFGEKFSNYSIDGESLTTYMAKLISDIGEATMSPSFVIFGKRFVKAGILKKHRDMNKRIEKFKTVCTNLISKKMKELEDEEGSQSKSEKKNLLYIFYEQRKTNPKEALTDKDIFGEFITFFLAGMDTTGHLVTMATYYLIKNPQYKERLMEEIEKYCPDSSSVDIENLNKMEFMTSFMKECLRIATPAPLVFERQALADHRIGDLEIKAGTFVNASFISNNFNKAYHSDPEKFDPERWLNPDSLTMKSITADPFIFTPFSIGGRNCIGQHMAMNEARVLFSLFLKNFNYELSNKNFKPNMTMRFLYEFEEDLKLDLDNKLMF